MTAHGLPAAAPAFAAVRAPYTAWACCTTAANAVLVQQQVCQRRMVLTLDAATEAGPRCAAYLPAAVCALSQWSSRQPSWAEAAAAPM